MTDIDPRQRYPSQRRLPLPHWRHGTLEFQGRSRYVQTPIRNPKGGPQNQARPERWNKQLAPPQPKSNALILPRMARPPISPPT